MKAHEFEIIGVFNTQSDLQLACKELKQKNINNFNTVLIGTTAPNLTNQVGKVKIYDVLLLLVWTLIPAILLGVFALFNFWDPQSQAMTMLAVLFFSIFGALLGYFKGFKVLKKVKARYEKKQIYVKVDTASKVNQTKVILDKSNAIDIMIR